MDCKARGSSPGFCDGGFGKTSGISAVERERDKVYTKRQRNHLLEMDEEWKRKSESELLKKRMLRSCLLFMLLMLKKQRFLLNMRFRKCRSLKEGWLLCWKNIRIWPHSGKGRSLGMLMQERFTRARPINGRRKRRFMCGKTRGGPA